MIDESQMTLAVDLDGRQDVHGWLASEKLNGCRAFWDGRQFWTRGGNVIAAPKWFTRGLPHVPLDGEIWAGRGIGFGNANSGFQIARLAVQYGRFIDAIRFAVFDFPALNEPWLRRMAEARKAVKSTACAFAVPFQRVSMGFENVPGCVRLHKYMAGLYRAGAEGGMFRNPDAVGYEKGRSDNMLRLKFCE